MTILVHPIVKIPSLGGMKFIWGLPVYMTMKSVPLSDVQK